MAEVVKSEGDTQVTRRSSEQPDVQKVILWSNGLVMTFDANGDQLPEYQGRISRNRLRDRLQALHGTIDWCLAYFEGTPPKPVSMSVSRDQFFERAV